MKAAKAIGAALCSIWLAGFSQPQTAAEFRNGAPNGIAPGAIKETFEVNRPLAQVGATFRKLASECLSTSIRSASFTRFSSMVVTTTYKPTVHVSSSGAELQVQATQRGNIINVMKEPEGGGYLLIADARAAGAAKTRIDLYRVSVGHAQMAQAVRDWVSGTNATCPSQFTGY